MFTLAEESCFVFLVLKNNKDCITFTSGPPYFHIYIYTLPICVYLAGGQLRVNLQSKVECCSSCIFVCVEACCGKLWQLAHSGQGTRTLVPSACWILELYSTNAGLCHYFPLLYSIFELLSKKSGIPMPCCRAKVEEGSQWSMMAFHLTENVLVMESLGDMWEVLVRSWNPRFLCVYLWKFYIVWTTLSIDFGDVPHLQ